MPRIVAINGSPRNTWNTATLVRDAADGAREAGAEVQAFDLYSLEPFMGCRSCFACKLERSAGICAYRDGLTPVLDAIRSADGVIIGSPNYLGDIDAGVYALIERLVFQNITYRHDPGLYHEPKTPCLFVMTSNVGEEAYEGDGFYVDMLAKRVGQLERAIGPTQTLISGRTLQVDDYSRYDWTIFDPAERIERREKVFPIERAHARALGAKLASGSWD